MIDIEKFMAEVKRDDRKFLVQLLLAAAALIGVGIALGRFVVFHA